MDPRACNLGLNDAGILTLLQKAAQPSGILKAQLFCSAPHLRFTLREPKEIGAVSWDFYPIAFHRRVLHF